VNFINGNIDNNPQVKANMTIVHNILNGDMAVGQSNDLILYGKDDLLVAA